MENYYEEREDTRQKDAIGFIIISIVALLLYFIMETIR